MDKQNISRGYDMINYTDVNKKHFCVLFDRLCDKNADNKSNYPITNISNNELNQNIYPMATANMNDTHFDNENNSQDINHMFSSIDSFSNMTISPKNNDALVPLNETNDDTNDDTNDETNDDTNDDTNDETNYETNDDTNDDTSDETNDEANDLIQLNKLHETNDKTNKLYDKNNATLTYIIPIIAISMYIISRVIKKS
jgi:hypothetical protein